MARSCECGCGETFSGALTRRFASDACRKRAARRRKKERSDADTDPDSGQDNPDTPESAPDTPVKGSRAPRFSHTPAADDSVGPDAVKLAAEAGLDLDDWQADALHAGMGVREDGAWAATEVCIIAPRQNGKTAIIEAAVLYSLFEVDGQLILWSSHEFRTSRESFKRMRAHIEGTPRLREQVEAIRTANGNEAIELTNGSVLKFVARSRGSGRGFAADLVILDEAMILDDHAISALLPTLSARGHKQVWYVASAPHLTSSVLRRVALRGRSGESDRLAYVEYAAAADADSSDVRAWLEANPAMGGRLTLEFTAQELEAMDEDDFRRERLGVWAEEGFETVVDLATWADLADPTEEIPLDPIALAFDVSPSTTEGGKRASIAVAGRREDGLVHVEVVEERSGTRWLPDRLLELTESHEPCAVVFDGRSPAAALVPQLAERGLEVGDPLPGEPQVVEITATDFARACEAIYDAIEDAQVRHFDQEELTGALEVAARRRLGESWAWSRGTSSGSIAPLVAVTLAHHGLLVHGVEEEEPVPLVAIR